RTIHDGTGPGKLALSPNGKILATASEAGVCLWDTVTGKALRCIPGKFRTNAITFTPDGKTLLTDGKTPPTGPHDHYPGVSIQHWEVGTGKLLREKKIEMDPRSRLMGFRGGHFSADGKTLIVTSHEAVVTLWDVASGKRRLHYKSESGGRL